MATTKKETTIEDVPELILPKEEKMVRIQLPIEFGNKDQEDKVVWVNERRFLIKRGTPVDVPESVALILQQEERMLQYGYEFENNLHH